MSDDIPEAEPKPDLTPRQEAESTVGTKVADLTPDQRAAIHRTESRGYVHVGTHEGEPVYIDLKSDGDHPTRTTIPYSSTP